MALRVESAVITGKVADTHKRFDLSAILIITEPPKRLQAVPSI